MWEGIGVFSFSFHVVLMSVFVGSDVLFLRILRNPVQHLCCKPEKMAEKMTLYFLLINV